MATAQLWVDLGSHFMVFIVQSSSYIILPAMVLTILLFSVKILGKRINNTCIHTMVSWETSSGVPRKRFFSEFHNVAVIRLLSKMIF